MDTSAQPQDSFHCPYDGCSKRDHGYTRREKLNDHIRSQHTGLRFPCPDCRKSFVRLGDLRKHSLAVHEGRKDFVCEPESSDCGCGKRFTKKSSLNRHQQNNRGFITNEPEDLLDRKITELRSDPDLRAQFAELLEYHIEDLQISSLGVHQDGLLSRSAIIDESSSISDSGDSGQAFDDAAAIEDEAIDMVLYQRLVRIFRSRRARTLRVLLEDAKETVQQANEARLMRSINLPCLLSSLDRVSVMTQDMTGDFRFHETLLPIRLQDQIVRVRPDNADMYSLLDIPGMSPKIAAEFVDHITLQGCTWVHCERCMRLRPDSAMLRWAAKVLMRRKPIPITPTPAGAHFERSRHRSKRLTNTYFEAHDAASCLHSLSAGHTDSVDDVFDMPREKEVVSKSIDDEEYYYHMMEWDLTQPGSAELAHRESPLELPSAASLVEEVNER